MMAGAGKGRQAEPSLFTTGQVMGVAGDLSGAQVVGYGVWSGALVSRGKWHGNKCRQEDSTFCLVFPLPTASVSRGDPRPQFGLCIGSRLDLVDSMRDGMGRVLGMTTSGAGGGGDEWDTLID